MTDHIEITRPDSHPGVLVLRFNRPDKKNAITQAMYQKLTAGLLEGVPEADCWTARRRE